MLVMVATIVRVRSVQVLITRIKDCLELNSKRLLGYLFVTRESIIEYTKLGRDSIVFTQAIPVRCRNPLRLEIRIYSNKIRKDPHNNQRPTMDETDRQTEARLAEIEQQVKQQPLTSDKLPLESLQAEYTASSGSFLAGLAALRARYTHVRRIRGDGNCYYRAILYRLAEVLEEQPDLRPIMVERIQTSWQKVQDAGYDAMMLDVFYESVDELIQKPPASLHDELNVENSASDYCTWYLRVVVAVHLKADPDRFLPYMNGLDVDSFCKTFVEPMGQECEQVQVLCLAEALGLQVVVVYLDGHELVDGKVTEHVFGSGPPRLEVLYRPGHYDILYPK